MKLLVPLLLLLIASFIGCYKKSMPVITARSTTPPKRVAVYADEGSVTADTVTGKAIFMSRCSRCHGIPDPAAYTAKKWEDILESMIPRSGTDKINAVHLRAYVIARAIH